MSTHRKWATFFFVMGIIGTIAFVASPQPYGLIGFLNFLWAWMLWNE